MTGLLVLITRIVEGLLVLVALIVGGYYIIRKGWYSQALMISSGLAGLFCGIAGLVKLTDSADTNDVVGAILIGIGILTTTALGIIVRVLSRNKPSASKAIQTTPDCAPDR